MSTMIIVPNEIAKSRVPDDLIPFIIEALKHFDGATVENIASMLVDENGNNLSLTKVMYRLPLMVQDGTIKVIQYKHTPTIIRYALV